MFIKVLADKKKTLQGSPISPKQRLFVTKLCPASRLESDSPTDRVGGEPDYVQPRPGLPGPPPGNKNLLAMKKPVCGFMVGSRKNHLGN